MPERFEGAPISNVFTIDISEGWDTPSFGEIFKREIHKLPFYRAGLLYSGFEGSSGRVSGTVCCTKESAIGMGADDDRNQDPLHFALETKHPAIAIYDPKYMKSLQSKARLAEYKDKILSPEALLATIILK